MTLTGANSYSSTTLTAATANSATLNVGTFGGSDTTGTLGSGNVTMSGGGVLNINRSNAYNFGGGITGSGVSAGSLNQLGTGMTTVTGAISNITSVNVSAGALTTSNTVNQSGGITVTGTGSYTTNGSISGTGVLSVNTTGAVALNASNSYTGGTSISGGTVNLNAAGALPSNSSLGVDGGTLNLNGNNISVTSFLDTTPGGAIVNNGPASSISTITYNGVQANNDVYAAVNDGAGGGKIAIVSSISNTQTAGVTYALRLHSSGTYSGGTVVNSQSIEADATNAFGTGPISVSQNNASTNSSQILLGPGVSISNNITIAQGNPLPITATGAFGVIQQTAAGGDSNVYGTVTIQANNLSGGLFNGAPLFGSDYMNIHGAVNTTGTANMVIQRSGQVRYFGGGNYPNIALNGIAQLGATNGLNQSAVIQMATLESGTFDLGGFNQTAVALSAVSANAATVFNSGAGFNTLTLNTVGSNTFNGTIDGNINLTVGGTGTQILTGANTYAGDTRVQGGTLSITQPYLADSADVYVSSGALFDLNFTGDDFIDSLFLGGSPAAVGTWGGPGSGATNISSLLSGTGTLDVQTLGTVVGVPGDYNNNGVVDAADYVVWRKSVGQSSLTNRSGSIIGPVGQADFNFWRSRFGATSGAGSALAEGTVPEPSAAMLFVSCMLVLAMKRRS
jgi:fibronectin-binding autotransporter adhesin